MISAMDEQEVGCPDLALDVDSTEWILQNMDRLIKRNNQLKFIKQNFSYFHRGTKS